MEAQNRRLISLDEAKDDFLRGISHNLQTPLASIRGYAQQLAAEQPDRRLDIITEQSDRLSRMVRQLLTVTRIESGALRSRLEVFALGPLVRRTWEALGAEDVAFTLDDRSEGWLALGDRDQLDQVLWAMLENALRYGGRSAIDVTHRGRRRVRRPAAHHRRPRPGVARRGPRPALPALRAGRGPAERRGTGLGLYVSRELCRAMGGDLVLDPPADGRAPRSRSACRRRLPRRADRVAHLA